MKKTVGVFLLYFLCSTALKAQYLQIVAHESKVGSNATFISAGQAEKKKELEIDAVKSLFYTLFFQGVEGVNDGKPLVSKPNPMYTNSFFDNQARYTPYLISVDEASKPVKVGGRMQGTMRITIRIDQLIRDVRTNTGFEEKVLQEKKTVAKPTIIVVPYIKEGENYKSILENSYNYRMAVGSVQKGFQEAGIKTVVFEAALKARERGMQYEENAGAAESNDRQLLLSSGADVYVTVDIKESVAGGDKRIDLQLNAYEMTNGTHWGTENGWAKAGRYATGVTVEEICSRVIKRHIEPFLDQIIENYSNPVRTAIKISISDSSVGTLLDTDCSNGENVMEFIENWLFENAYESQYNIRGTVAESAIVEDVLIPRQDEKGRKMTASRFARMLNSALKDNGISGSVRLEGNSIMLMLNL